MYLKRISTTNTLINDQFNNFDSNPTKLKNEFPSYLSSYLKKKEKKTCEKKGSVIDNASSKAGESDNIFVKAFLVEQLETKKCIKFF